MKHKIRVWSGVCSSALLLLCNNESIKASAELRLILDVKLRKFHRKRLKSQLTSNENQTHDFLRLHTESEA